MTTGDAESICQVVRCDRPAVTAWPRGAGPQVVPICRLHLEQLAGGAMYSINEKHEIVIRPRS